MYNKKYYSATTFGARYNYCWDEEEDKMVLDHEIPDRKLSEILQRSVGSIQHRRFRLKTRQRRNELLQEGEKIMYELYVNGHLVCRFPTIWELQNYLARNVDETKESVEIRRVGNYE